MASDYTKNDALRTLRIKIEDLADEKSRVLKSSGIMGTDLNMRPLPILFELGEILRLIDEVDGQAKE